MKLGLGLSLTQPRQGGGGGGGFVELWVQPPSIHTGLPGFYDVAGNTITINRGAGGVDEEGSFQSDALVQMGTPYVLEFDFPNTGGANEPWYSIDIRYSNDGSELAADHGPPTPGHKVINFTPIATTRLLFTLPDAGWSATYSNISLREA